MSGPVEIVLIIAAIGYLLARRLMGEPLQVKRMLVLPAVLGIIGLTDLSGDVRSPGQIALLVGTVGVSVVLGALRGLSVRVSERDGFPFVRYTAVTVVLWVVNIVVKFGANYLAGVVDPKDAGALSNSLLLTLGAGMLVEGLVTLARSMRAGTVAFAGNN